MFLQIFSIFDILKQPLSLLKFAIMPGTHEAGWCIYEWVNYATIGSDSGLSQAIICTNALLLSTVNWTLRNKFQ